jgi:UDP-2,3-diacylglucosamine hydrolase
MSLRIGRDEPVLFASDMHLSAHAPRTAERFLRALDGHGGSAAHLFLLGDLFELWVGDDTPDPVADVLAARLAALSAGGVRVWLMRGNRDFLLGIPMTGGRTPRFDVRCGATLLPDPYPLDLHGEAALLAHGDALCTDDAVYQAWRHTCRDPAWQQAFLARPLAQRQAMGRAIRDDSEAGRRERTDALTDVNADTVDRVMAEAGVGLLIHGHTHRPADHRWRAGGCERRRVVLTDWDDAAGRGTLLRWEGGAARPLV